MQSLTDGYRSLSLIVRLNFDTFIYVLATAGGLAIGGGLGMLLLQQVQP